MQKSAARAIQKRAIQSAPSPRVAEPAQLHSTALASARSLPKWTGAEALLGPTRTAARVVLRVQHPTRQPPLCWCRRTGGTAGTWHAAGTTVWHGGRVCYERVRMFTWTTCGRAACACSAKQASASDSGQGPRAPCMPKPRSTTQRRALCCGAGRGFATGRFAPAGQAPCSTTALHKATCCITGTSASVRACCVSRSDPPKRPTAHQVAQVLQLVASCPHGLAKPCVAVHGLCVAPRHLQSSVQRVAVPVSAVRLCGLGTEPQSA